MAYISLSQKRSTIGSPKKLRVIVSSLGLRRIGQTRYYRDTRALRGQINKVRHLLSYTLLTSLPDGVELVSKKPLVSKEPLANNGKISEQSALYTNTDLGSLEDER